MKTAGPLSAIVVSPTTPCLPTAGGADFHPLTVCAACRGPLRDGDLTVTGGTHPVQATM